MMHLSRGGVVSESTSNLISKYKLKYLYGLDLKWNLHQTFVITGGETMLFL